MFSTGNQSKSSQADKKHNQRLALAEMAAVQHRCYPPLQSQQAERLDELLRCARENGNSQSSISL